MAPTGKYIEANGMSVYYETYGEGEPLLLIHGGTATSQSWASHLPAFAGHFRVYAPDSRGHGRTDNPAGELGYRLMADDVAALIDALGLQRPLVLGYSDGGQIALELGMRYPGLTRALVLGGTQFRFSEAYLEAARTLLGIAEGDEVDPEKLEREQPDFVNYLLEAHGQVYGPEYWKSYTKQIASLWLTPLRYTSEDLAAIVDPVLVLAGDRDGVCTEEASELFRLLRNAELAVAPGSDHGFIEAKAKLFDELALDFLVRHRRDPLGGSMTTRRGPKQKRRLREDRSRQAGAIAVTLARENGLRVEEPTILNDLFSLMLHLRLAPVVARVATYMPKLRTLISAWLEREIAVTTYLSEMGAPVVTPSRELPLGPHERDGFWLSFWTYVEPDPDRTATTDDCSALLPDLHAALRLYPGELPALCADDVTRGLEALDAARDVLDESDVDLLCASAARLRPLWEAPGGEVQPLHGDVHPGNLISARDGGLVWIDFEDVCLGPVEWDRATIMDPGAVAEHHRYDPEMLAHCTELRALQVALCLIAFYDDFGDIEGWKEGIRSMLNMLASVS